MVYGRPYYLCKALISRSLATGGKASLMATAYPSCKHMTKSNVVYYFLTEMFAKFWLMWSTEHEEKCIFEVENRKEVRSLFT